MASSVATSNAAARQIRPDICQHSLCRFSVFKHYDYYEPELRFKSVIARSGESELR